MFSRIRLRTKLALLLALFAGGLVLTLALNASALHRRMVQDRVETLKAAVDMVIGYADSLERRVAAHELTREQELSELRAVVHTLRFDGGQGYISLSTLAGMTLIHIDPKRENQVSTATDGAG